MEIGIGFRWHGERGLCHCQFGRLEQLEAALAQQQEIIAHLQQENAELSRPRLEQGSVQEIAEEPTVAPSITEGLDLEFGAGMSLDAMEEDEGETPSE